MIHKKLTFMALLGVYAVSGVFAQNFTGDGGKGKSIAILPFKATGLAKELDYIPALVQGEFVSNFSGYSVLDRQKIESVYDELESGQLRRQRKGGAGFRQFADA